MNKIILLPCAVFLSTSAFAQIYNATATQIWQGISNVATNTGLVADPNSSYSNVTNFLSAYTNAAGATTINGDGVTVLDADDINTSTPGAFIKSFTFSVYNGNATATNARALIRFYTNDPNSGDPGVFLGGYNVSAISFAGNHEVELYKVNINPTQFQIPADGAIWAGISFDNNSGATGASLTALQNLGQGIFDPPTVGTSTDDFFETDTAGDYPSNNPVGGDYYFPGGPTANFGWGFTAVPEPTSFAVLGLVLVGLARRRRTAK